MAREKVLVGIDIGSTKIATVIALAEADGEMRIIGSASVPSSGIRKSQVIDIEAALGSVTQSVEAAERMAGYSIGSVYLSVGGAHIGCQNSHGVVAVADPGGEITREDVRRVTEAAQAISLPSSREIVHVRPRHFAVDSQEDIRDPVGMTGIRLEVETHIVHGAATTMRNQARVVQELGIDVEGLVYSGLAAAEATLTETEKELGVVLVDLGGGTTSICVFVESALTHSAVLPVGARNVSNDLAIGLRVSLEDAEKIKLYLGREGKTPVLPDGKETKKKNKHRDEIDLQALGLSGEAKKVSRRTLLEGIIKPRLVEIFSYVQLELKRAEVLGLTPAGVVLTGGGAQTIGAVEVGKVGLSLPVRIGRPHGVSGLVDEVSSPAFASTVGLVLYGAKQQEDALEGWGGIMPKFSLGQTVLQDVVGKMINVIKSFIP